MAGAISAGAWKWIELHFGKRAPGIIAATGIVIGIILASFLLYEGQLLLVLIVVAGIFIPVLFQIASKGRKSV